MSEEGRAGQGSTRQGRARQGGAELERGMQGGAWLGWVGQDGAKQRGREKYRMVQSCVAKVGLHSSSRPSLNFTPDGNYRETGHGRQEVNSHHNPHGGNVPSLSLDCHLR